jgi:hypothetical protein
MINTQLIILIISVVVSLATIIGGQTFWLARYLNSEFTGVRREMNARFDTSDAKIDGLGARLVLVETDVRAIKV